VYDSGMCSTGMFYGAGYVALACGTWCYDVVCGIGMCYMVLVQSVLAIISLGYQARLGK